MVQASRNCYVEQRGATMWKQARWSPAEDMACCRSYLRVSEDPLVGNNQSKEVFEARAQVVSYHPCCGRKASLSVGLFTGCGPTAPGSSLRLRLASDQRHQTSDVFPVR